MTHLLFKETPPQGWDKRCESYGDIFNHTEWHQVMSRGFSSKILYGWDENSSVGIAITVFRAGPFRIGYVGFPVGSTMGNNQLDTSIIEVLEKCSFPMPVHCLRIPASTFKEGEDIPLPLQSSSGIVSTVIYELQQWQVDLFPKLYRDIKKAKNSPLTISDAVDVLQGDYMFNIYRETVERHNGRMRYKLDYFRELIKLSRICSRVRCILAMMDSKITGFLVVVCHNGTAYYLHSGMDLNYKVYSPSDLLLSEAIEWAKQEGMDCFHLMESPKKQIALVRYKEKWGGVTRAQKIYELPVSPLKTFMFNSSARLYDSLSRFIM